MNTRPGPGGDRLEILLREQRDALRSGRLDALASLVPRLEEAVEQLAQAGATGDLARLREAAAENLTLLAAARTGVDRARRTRRDAASASLSTYDRAGRVSAPVPPPGRTLSRR